MSPSTKTGKSLLTAICAGLLLLTTPPDLRADLRQNVTRDIGYQQRLGEKISPELTFVDEEGRSVKLADYLGARPVVLAMGYYGCPMLCGVSLQAAAHAIDQLTPESPARDFDFIFVSIDPRERFALAGAKKREILRRLATEPDPSRWHFLTGSSDAPRALARQIGFQFRYDAQSKQYIHPSGLVVLSPAGKISSYLLGIDYPPRDFAQALTMAHGNETRAIAKTISILCFSGEQVIGSVSYYALVALRIGALLTLIGLFLFVRSRTPRPARKPPSG